MKRVTLSLISLASFVSMSAQAQSSVTLYGTVDTSLTYVNHAQNKENLLILGNSSAGNLTGSNWGLTGAEDLGGGLRAIFKLESGFDPASGKQSGGRLFGNQAFLGLASDRYGTVALGRQYDPLVDLVQPITAGSYFGSAFATAGDVDNYDNSFRVDKAIKYTSPVMSGLQIEAMYSLGGIAGSTGSAQSYSAGMAYDNGTLRMAGGYFYAANSPAASGLRTEWTSSSDGTFGSPVSTGYATAHSISIARVAGQYALGAVTFGAGYSNAQYHRDGSSVFGSNEHYNTAQGFLNYQATSALLVGAGYSYTKSGGNTSANYHQASLGADYSLSKRTDVYMTAAYQHAGGATTDGNGGAMAAQASIGSYGYVGTNSQTMVNVGLRHKF
ncbi:porin (plasmid) [Paraburkholderia acidicola]|uniref:Porin n=1 Tax=Paraburkholderia acidicola TaxID=1912599 RepID=A0ABV1LYS7_9BURK